MSLRPGIDDLSPLDIARMKALKQYAALEHELCNVLRYSASISYEQAHAIFYNISSTRTRYNIIDDMLSLQSDDARSGMKASWKKISAWLIARDGARNGLVHWQDDFRTIVTLVPMQEGETVLGNAAQAKVRVEQHLANPSKTGQPNYAGPRLTVAQIFEERDAARVMMHIVNRFSLCLREPPQWPWTHVFQQPISHRRPTEFLSHLNSAGLPAQLPPYEA